MADWIFLANYTNLYQGELRRVLVTDFPMNKLNCRESHKISKWATDQALAYLEIKFTLNGESQDQIDGPLQRGQTKINKGHDGWNTRKLMKSIATALQKKEQDDQGQDEIQAAVEERIP